MKRSNRVLAAVFAVGLVFVAGSWACGRSPAVTGRSAQQVAQAYTCPMHPAYRSDRPGDCPMCGMRLVPVGSVGNAAGAGATAADTPGMVQINADRQQLMGVRVDEVVPASAAHLTLRVPGRVAVDEQRLYRITAAVDGWIRQLGPNPAGSFVKKNQILASYYAQNLISAAQTYVFALQTNAQAQSGDATIGYQRGTTQLSLLVALDSLRALGMSEYQIKEIEKTRIAPTEIRVYSPINGFVVARDITPEQRFDKGTEMYRISDISHVWVMAGIFEKDGEFLKQGTRATVFYQGRRLEARMSAALPQFDPQTRTLKTRFELDNPGNVLRPDMYVDVEIQAEMPPAVTVPADAIVDSGLRKTVFVDRGNGYFEPRRVETGWRMGDRVQVVKGVMAGERIVISGTFLLDSESRMRTASQSFLGAAAIDPVCGMDVDETRAGAAGRKVAYKGSTFFFCSDQCKRDFEKDPGRYVNVTGRPPAPQPAGATTKAASMPDGGATPPAPAATAKDPVCGMDVEVKEAAAAGRKSVYKGKSYYFCSAGCKKTFDADPAKYEGK